MRRALMALAVCTHLVSAAVADGTVPLPAAPGRGYAMHPAIAGDRLVFVADGDLWTARLNGDLSKPIEAARLTSGTGMETAPVLSPDGSMLAFMADYDGTPEVYAMPVTGGAPKRLTFHPSTERPLAFTADGAQVIYRSDRANALGRTELWSVPVVGGPSKPLGIGEGSLASIDAATGRMAFTPWSNENWSWKRYRGGTAPDLWITDAERKNFTRLTKTKENELFPMWLQGRVWFLSDADGRMNLCSVAADGSDRKQHTTFAANELEPRWAKADPGKEGSRIVFTRGADVVLFDAKDGAQRTLDLRLIGDRFADRQRQRPATESASGLSLSPGADALLIESRGEFAVVPLASAGHRVLSGLQAPNTSGKRERGAAWLDASTIAYVTEHDDGYAIVARDLGDTESGESVLATCAVWLMDPVASPDGAFVAFGDKTGVLRLVNVDSGAVTEIDRSENGAIRDCRFSPDGAWLAWQRPLTNGFAQIVVRELASGKTGAIGNGMTNDMSPRWDPAGAYLYFLSDRHIDPVMDGMELNFANVNTTTVCALPLKVSVPPPFAAEAAEAEFDLEAWATGKLGAWSAGADKHALEHEAEGKGAASKGAAEAEAHDEDADDDDGPSAPFAISVDLDGMAERVTVLPVAPGNFDAMEAAAGAVLLGRRPLEGVASEPWPAPPLGKGGTHLERFDIAQQKSSPVLEKPIEAWVMDGTATQVVVWDGERMSMVAPAGGEPTELGLEGVQVDVDPRQEWRQMFDEAWRLQRDFFWRSDMGGVDWNAARQRYLPLVDRVGTRQELNDLIGQMSSELGNSHVYIDGGEEFRKPEHVEMATLGADVEPRDGGWVITRVLPDFHATGGPESPLAAPFRGVKPGMFVVEVDGKPVFPDREIGAALAGRAGHATMLTLADAPDGTGARVVEVTLPPSDSALRYFDWVETNRRAVAQRSGGRLGYMHIPDMDTAGITAFMRTFYPQVDREGMVVDVRNNGGGYVSPVLVERLSRKPWAYSVPRDGRAETTPNKTLVGPIAVLIDQDAGSDGDIFPESMREMKNGTLIGTRTWGGVIGIEGDKPFVDGGMATQPGWGHWTPSRGYAMENQGVAPDIEVEITPADRAAGRDPQLDKAIETLSGKLPAKRFVPPRPETQPPTSPTR